MVAGWLEEIVGPNTPPFALLHRPESRGADRIELLRGAVSTVETIADLPADDVLALLPYRQITERGFDCADDGTPLVAMRITSRATMPVTEFLDQAPDVPVALRDGRFSIDDDEYARLVRQIITDEIGSGEGANFVIKRSFVATVDDYSIRTALAVFRRLLRDEHGAYWTFLVHTGDRTLIGASPERHISVVGGVATMNPISGTYRYPPTGTSLAGVLGFLDDPKESDELFMVLDEELKMMGRICESGGRVVGPQLKPMARLAHTEYLIEGRTGLDAREILRETLFAPTVTGSPLESACRVIARYEPEGRGYYSGVLALIERAPDGRQLLDSAILIRTADLNTAGDLRVGVGATLVRHSDPASEVAETSAKAAALLATFGHSSPDGREAASKPGRPGAHAASRASGGPAWQWDPAVQRALRSRNSGLARFWLDPDRQPARESMAGRRALVVDCEDTFTSMLGHQLTALGLDVTVRRFDERPDPDGYDLVVLGPGPGDPTHAGHPKIATMRALTTDLLDTGTPLLAICLGHQVLASVLGLEVVRRPVPNQGVQLPIDFFGRVERCGFYNTFAARSATDHVVLAAARGVAEATRDPDTGEVHGLRGQGFRSLQFHPESVLTENGLDILGELASGLLPVATASA